MERLNFANGIGEHVYTPDALDLRKDEYQKDGEIVCLRCGNARTVRHPKEGWYTRCLCKCEKEREARAAQEDYWEREKENAGIPARYREMTFKSLRDTGRSFGEARNMCEQYALHPEKVRQKGYGFYLFGEPGTGKTTLACCIANELISRYKNVYMVSLVEVSKRIRERFGDKDRSEAGYIDYLSTVDYLILDDVGTEKLLRDGEETWLQERIYDVINGRYNRRLPTIFTSNYSLHDLVSARGMARRTADRIAEMSSAVVEVKAENYRMKNRQQSMEF